MMINTNLSNRDLIGIVLAYALVIALAASALFFLSGCAGHYYEDNPRNMQGMSADQLKRELGVK